MRPSEFLFSISVQSYDEKTAENCRNCYVTDVEYLDLNEDCVQISRSYLVYFPRNKPSGRFGLGSVGSGRAGSSF